MCCPMTHSRKPVWYEFRPLHLRLRFRSLRTTMPTLKTPNSSSLSCWVSSTIRQTPTSRFQMIRRMPVRSWTRLKSGTTTRPLPASWQSGTVQNQAVETTMVSSESNWSMPVATWLPPIFRSPCSTMCLTQATQPMVRLLIMVLTPTILPFRAKSSFRQESRAPTLTSWSLTTSCVRPTKVMNSLICS